MVVLLPLLGWLILLPCGDVVTTIRACLADVIANVVADVIATFVLILADVVPTIVEPLIHLLLKALLCQWQML